MIGKVIDNQGNKEIEVLACDSVDYNATVRNDVVSGSDDVVTSDGIYNKINGIFDGVMVENAGIISSSDYVATETGILYIGFNRKTTSTSSITEDGKLIWNSDFYSSSTYVIGATILIRKGHTYKWIPQGAEEIRYQNFIPLLI